MTNIRAAQGNNAAELISDSINIIAGQFSEGINAGVNGLKQMFGSGGGIGNFAPNGQQQRVNEFPEGMNGPPTADEINAGKLSSEKVMQAKEVDFFGGPEDTRAVSQIKQVGSQ